MCQVVFADEGFADYVGICHGCGRMGEDMAKVDFFVGGYLKKRRCRRG